MIKKIFFIFCITIFFYLTNSSNIYAKEKNTKKKNIDLKKLVNQEEEKPITLEDIDKLGSIPTLKKLPEEMYEELESCKPYNEHFSGCESKKAGKIVGTTFRKKGGYGEKYPGKMMEAMAYFEILYLSSLYKNKKKIEKFKKEFSKYKGDRKYKSIRSLIKMNDGREKMRSALGMSLETPTEEAIKRFWTLGEFLGMGTPKKLGINDKDINKRKKLLQKYKATVSRLKEKLEEESN